MKTLEIKLFTFEELSEKVQAKLIEKHRNINVFDDWHDDSINSYQEELIEVGFNDAKISYSGFWSQGDGLSFDAKIDIDKFAETPSEKRVANLINNGDIDTFTICKNHYANHYSHVRTRYIDVPFIQSYKHTNIEAILGVLKERINDKRVELCDKYYRELETEYNRLVSDEEIKATLIENEYDYLEDGRIY